MIVYEQLHARPDDWDDRIDRWDTKTLFHTSAWLDHVQSIHPAGELVYYRLLREGETVGYHCGLRIRKAFVPIHGSPLGGTGTNYMGPIVDHGTDQHELLKGLLRLQGVRQFLHIELSNPFLDRDVLLSQGFQVHEGVTHIVEVSADPETAWANLKGPARNRIRKAQANGLVVEHTEDPAIVDHFFDQFIEVYGKQGMATPFGRERPRSLFQHLFPAGHLLPLWVRRDDEILAAGLFPYDEKAIYFWGAGSWLRHQSLCPNEALQWGVIEFASRRGIPVYNMCGGRSQFKNKFGGEDVPYPIYYRSSLPLLSTARRAYRAWHFRALRQQRSVQG